MRDALSLEPASYDLVAAFDVIHDLPRPAEALASSHAALRDEGVFLMVDIAASSHLHENLEHPLGPTLGGHLPGLRPCPRTSFARRG